MKVNTVELVASSLDIFSEETKKTRLTNICLELRNSVNEEVMKKVSYYIGKMILDVY